MSVLFRAKSLPARFGFEGDKNRLKQERSIRHASVNKRDYSGTRHGVLYKLELDGNDGPVLEVDHWAHFPDGSNHKDEVLSVHFDKIDVDGEEYFQISRFRIFDKDLINLADKDVGDNEKLAEKLPGALKAILETISCDNEVPDIPTILEDFGVGLKNVGRRNLLGINRAGRTDHSIGQKKEEETAGEKECPLYSLEFMPTLIGVEPHANDDDIGPIEVHDIVKDPKSGEEYNVYYRYERNDKEPVSTRVSCHVSDGSESGQQCLYDLIVEQKEKGSEFFQVKAFTMMDQPVDIEDGTVLTRALETVRMHNRAIREQSYSRSEGDVFSGIIFETGILPHLFKSPPPPSIKEGGRFRARVLGGINENDAVLNDEREHSIGGKSVFVSNDYEYTDGKTYSDCGLIDNGIGFLDWKKDGFDYWKAFIAPYLRHRSDPPDQVPKDEALWLLFSHKHKDHFFWDAQFVPPVFIMEPLTHKQFVDDMKALKSQKQISKEACDEILGKCYVIDPAEDINPDKPDKIYKTTFGDVVIERTTEVFKDEEKAGGVDYAPQLRIYHKDRPEGGMTLRLNYTSHSVPNLMVDIVTPSKTIGITGDFKMSKQVHVAKPTSKAWISAVKRDLLLLETTGADRPERTPEYDQLEEHLYKAYLSRVEHGKRLILPMMPNDMNTLFTALNALKRVRAEMLRRDPESMLLEYVTFDGASLEAVAKHLNDGKGKLKDFLAKEEKDENGNVVKAPIIFQGRNTQAIKNRAERRTPDLAIVITGTQGEEMAVTDRLIRGELSRWSLGPDDSIFFGKNTIPVASNSWKRRRQKDMAESRYGCEVNLPEDWEKEHPGEFIAVSGHGGLPEAIEMAELSNADYIATEHGDRTKYDAVGKALKKKKIKILHLSHQDEFGGKKGEPLHIMGQTHEYRQFDRQVYSRPRFWLSKWTDRAVVPMPPVLRGPVGEMINAAEKAAFAQKEIVRNTHRRRYIASTQVANDNVEGASVFEPQQPIGVEKYKESFAERKGVGLIASSDTESTGLVHEGARLRSFGMHIRDYKSRRTLKKMEHFMATPKHVIWSLYAALVTNTHPKEFKKGDLPRVFAAKAHADLTDLRKHPKTEESTATILIGHNFIRHDARLLVQEFGENGQRDLYKHRGSGVYLLDTHALMRAVYAYAPDLFKFNYNEKTGLPDLSLGGFCKANGLSYLNKHTAIYDTYPTYNAYKLIEKKLKKAGREDILEQMLINSDTVADDMAKDIVGERTRPGDPKPVFSYVGHAAIRPEPRLGVVIGTEIDKTNGRSLVLFNLKYDPEQYLHLPQDEIQEMIADRDNDVFEMIRLDQCPILMPMDFAFRQGVSKKAIGNNPKDVYRARAAAVSSNLVESMKANAHARNTHNIQTKEVPFETRVLKAAGKALTAIYRRSRARENRGYQNRNKVFALPRLKGEWGLIKTSSDDMKRYDIAPTETEMAGVPDYKLIADMAFQLAELNNDDLRQLVEANIYDLWGALDDKEKSKVSRLISKGLRQQFNISCAVKRKRNKVRIMDNIQTALDNEHRRRVRSVHAPDTAPNITLKKAYQQLEEIKNNPELYEHYVGSNRKKEKIVEDWKAYLDGMKKDKDLEMPQPGEKGRYRFPEIPQRYKIGGNKPS